MRLSPGARLPGRPGPQVVYVSPLKALAVDIWQNLETPLAEIAKTAGRAMGLPAPDIRVAVRTGDTAAAERAAMLKRPPGFPDYHPGVAVPARDRGTEPGDAGPGPHRHRR